MLVKPVITEKTMRLARQGQFSFRVVKNVNKHQIKQEIEKLFKVGVTSVNTSRNKAVVTLKPGQTIDYFQLPEKKAKKAKQGKKS